MGTSCAVTYATIYFSYHEETQLIPRFKNMQILSYSHFVDDAIILQQLPNTTQPHDQLHNHKNYKLLAKQYNSFGTHENKLEWTLTKPSKTLNFLDLTITINDSGNIDFKTYQKSMNLYLYIPPSSNHPPGTFKGFITSALKCYWFQNSKPEDFIAITTSFIQ